MEGRMTTAPTTSGVQNELGRAKQKAYRSQTYRNHITVKHEPVEHNACQAKHGKSNQSMLIGETATHERKGTWMRTDKKG
jgi:hypothetical protein